MKILRTPADVAFSRCVRARVSWACERCGHKHQENSMGLHCSHHFGRGSWSVRFHPLNAEAMCYGCHQRYGGTHDRRMEVLGVREPELRELSLDTSLGRIYKRTGGKGEIAKHYRQERARIAQARADGVTGRVDFEVWLP